MGGRKFRVEENYADKQEHRLDSTTDDSLSCSVDQPTRDVNQDKKYSTNTMRNSSVEDSFIDELNSFKYLNIIYLSLTFLKIL